ncbi:hypothetical protein [Kaarinaea lacus]
MRYRYMSLYFALLVLPMCLNTVLADKIDDTCNKVNQIEKYKDYFEKILKLDQDDIQTIKEICLVAYSFKAKEPDRINKTLQPYIERHNGLAFLKDIDFKIRAFNTKDAPNGLGFSYNYSKTFDIYAHQYNVAKDRSYGFTWDFKTAGNVAFEPEINPHDFLDTRFAISTYHNSGGISIRNTEKLFQSLNDLEDRLADAETQEQHDKIVRQHNNLFDQVRASVDSTQFYFDANINAGMESNQSFTERQWTLGALLGMDLKNYNRSSNFSKFNVFDYPAALVRMFSGYFAGNKFIPLGAAFPSFLIGHDFVDPQKNSQRSALGEEDPYSRIRWEFYYRTPLANISKDTLYFNVDFRYLKEVDAPISIKNADLDEFTYTVLSFTTKRGAYLSYSTGRLPFDLQSQKAYEVGWKFNL